MIEGKICETQLTTPRLLEAIKEWQSNVPEPKGLSDGPPAPHWLQALRFALKADIEATGLSQEAQMELFRPVVELMRTMVLLYSDAGTEEEVKEALLDK